MCEKATGRHTSMLISSYALRAGERIFNAKNERHAEKKSILNGRRICQRAQQWAECARTPAARPARERILRHRRAQIARLDIPPTRLMRRLPIHLHRSCKCSTLQSSKVGWSSLAGKSPAPARPHPRFFIHSILRPATRAHPFMCSRQTMSLRVVVR